MLHAAQEEKEKPIFSTKEAQQVYNNFTETLKALGTDLAASVITENEKGEKSFSCSKAALFGGKVLIAAVTALGTLDNYYITNNVSLPHAIINSVVNIALNMRDVPGYIVDSITGIKDEFVKMWEDIKAYREGKKNGFDMAKAVASLVYKIGIVLTAAAASTGAGALLYEGTDVSLQKSMPDPSILKLLAQLGNLAGSAVTVALYTGPVAKLFLPGGSKIDLIQDWLKNSIKECLFRKDQNTALALVNFLGKLDFTDAKTLRDSMSLAYEKRSLVLATFLRSKILEAGPFAKDIGRLSLLAGRELNEEGQKESMAAYLYALTKFGVENLSWASTMVAAPYELGPSTIAGFASLTGITLPDIAGPFTQLPETYFLAINMAMGIYKSLAVVDRMKNQVQQASYGKAALTAVTYLAMGVIGYSTVSTILDQQSDAGSDKSKNPLMDYIDFAALGNLAASAFFGNFLAILTPALNFVEKCGKIMGFTDSLDVLEPIFEKILQLISDTFTLKEKTAIQKEGNITKKVLSFYKKEGETIPFSDITEEQFFDFNNNILLSSAKKGTLHESNEYTSLLNTDTEKGVHKKPTSLVFFKEVSQTRTSPELVVNW